MYRGSIQSHALPSEPQLCNESHRVTRAIRTRREEVVLTWSQPLQGRALRAKHSPLELEGLQQRFLKCYRRHSHTSLILHALRSVTTILLEKESWCCTRITPWIMPERAPVVQGQQHAPDGVQQCRTIQQFGNKEKKMKKAEH